MARVAWAFAICAVGSAACAGIVSILALALSDTTGGDRLVQGSPVLLLFLVLGFVWGRWAALAAGAPFPVVYAFSATGDAWTFSADERLAVFLVSLAPMLMLAAGVAARRRLAEPR